MNLLQNKNVYLALSKKLYDAPIFDRACAFIRAQSPHMFVEPSAMFKSNAEWKENFPQYLEAFDVCVLIADGKDMVGKGVYLEWTYFRDKNIPVYYFSEFPAMSSLIPVKDILIRDDDDWTNYAQVIL